MNSREKILCVLEKIKQKHELAPVGSVLNYRAGKEASGLTAEEEILILNKLEEDGAIEVVSNFANEYR